MLIDFKVIQVVLSRPRVQGHGHTAVCIFAAFQKPGAEPFDGYAATRQKDGSSAEASQDDVGYIWYHSHQ